MRPDKAEKFWDRLADRFDRAAKHFGSPPARQAKEYLKKDDVVLDFGCATGTVTCEVAGCVEQVVGIDISPKMIEIARNKTDELKIGNIIYKHSAIFDETLQAAAFDAVLAFNILHFFKDKNAVLRRINELLKPGGIVIIATEMVTFNYFVPLILIGAVPYMKFFTISGLNDALRENGFQIVTHEKSSATHFIVARKL